MQSDSISFRILNHRDLAHIAYLEFGRDNLSARFFRSSIRCLHGSLCQEYRNKTS